MRLTALSMVFLLGCAQESERERPVRPTAEARAEASEAAPEAQPEDEPVVARPAGRVLDRAVTVEAHVERPTHDAPEGAPHAIVHLPAGLDASRAIDVVVFLHGFRGCARVLALSGRVSCTEGRPARTGWGLIEEHDEAAANSVLVVMQLAFMERTGRAGRLAEDGVFGALLVDLLGAPFEEHLGIDVDLGALPITLVAHSAGYESALAILEHGRAEVRAVILLDALYSGADRFASFVEGDDARTLVSLYTGRASTYRESQRLTELTNGRARVERSPHPHGAIPRMQLAELLATTLTSRRAHAGERARTSTGERAR